MEKTLQTPIRRIRGATALPLAVVAIIAAAYALVLDKFLPHRIGPSYYAQILWVGRLSVVSFAVAVFVLVLGFATRQQIPIVLGLLTLGLLALQGVVHSGPNPQAWCFNNLREIDAAKEQLTLKNNLTNGVVVTAEQISPYIAGGFASLECAEKGTYTINPIGTEPRCSFHGSMSEMETQWKALMNAQRPLERSR